MTFLLTLLLSVLITIALIPILGRVAVRLRVLDVPNERKVHPVPIPRSGGVAMAIGALVPVIAWNHAAGFVPAYLAGAGLLVLTGMIDDSRGLGPPAKFAAQAVAALVVIVLGGIQIRSLGSLLPDGVVLPPWIGVPLTLVAIVGVTNAINLSDGLDGLAGGICLLVFCCIGYLAYLTGDETVGLAAVALSGCLFGFLRYNTHPATVFMGDAGSQFLGFSAVTLSLALTQADTPVSPLLPLIILGFPILDTLTVMLTRIAQGRSPFSADKNHFHHNLMGLGLSHAEAVLAIYVIQTLLIVSAFVFRFHSDWILLAGYLAFSASILSVFAAARKTGWRLKRYDLLDVIIAGNLRRLRDNGDIIRVTFRVFEIAIPLLLLVTCILPAKVPGYFAYLSPGVIAVVLAAWRFRAETLGTLLRLVLYLLIPFVVYLSDAHPAVWINDAMRGAYNACFGVFAVSIVIVSKFTRRKGGFKNTPMDFLIVFLAVVVPNLPEQHIQGYRMGLIAAKIIMLYFSYEMLMAEVRGKYGKIAVSTMASLTVLAFR
jgi:UDP-GlcNAc:undecaprenyl-phosphate GlcNAc-1-phosphate transferase